MIDLYVLVNELNDLGTKKTLFAPAHTYQSNFKMFCYYFIAHFLEHRIK